MQEKYSIYSIRPELREFGEARSRYEKSIKGRVSQELALQIQEKTNNILDLYSENDSFNAVLRRLKGRFGDEIGRINAVYKSGLEKFIKQNLKEGNEISNNLTDSYSFCFVQSLKSVIRLGLSLNTALKLAERSYILPLAVIRKLKTKKIEGVDGYDKGKTWGEEFSDSNITTICVRYNNPEEKLKSILIERYKELDASI
ncbi:MAG: hypothetical protein PHH06_05670 [Candidatus Gracilibacteria bacterium]|nr:hypothetical protein [Candidatus Gracilibacteria bacterium]